MKRCIIGKKVHSNNLLNFLDEDEWEKYRLVRQFLGFPIDFLVLPTVKILHSLIF